MKIDHIVVNVDEKYQKNNSIIENIRKTGLFYEPKKGKCTNGFKASNIWIGNEYFEMINILKPRGGGWVSEWTDRFNQGHRGMICLMLDIESIELLYENLTKKGIEISQPNWLEFKWFFNLFTRKMPWKNAYLPFFEKVPFQIGFQQLKDEKTRDFMNQYAIPNSRDNGISGINEIIISGEFSDTDFKLLQSIFDLTESDNNTINILLNSKQKLIFNKSNNYSVIVKTESSLNTSMVIENIKIIC
ncbi:MAG: hypothetical protein WAO56_07425 [Miniphocaeibacter sp.]|uniref:hypothetical protein n=1 Tax=Miniphocaeibacter sp. TaxID=3100973 RepID=UPI0017F64E15|nr:hypothetical protein [Gallicola sp.]